ncbi:MAG: Cof-type HAD-IIB family hydrolase [Lachnospiraceae bacterium]
MRNKKLLFVDLDDTILKDDGSISAENRKSVQLLLEQENYIAFATGRPADSARKIINNLGLMNPGCYIVAYNGALLYDCSADRILFERTIPVQDVYRLFSNAHDKGIYIQTYSNNGILTDNRTKELNFYLSRSRMPYKIVPDIESGLISEPNKVLLINLEDPKVLIDFETENESWTADRLSSVFTNDIFLEYMPLGIHKGSGIEYFCRLLNIPHENTIAIGNERNDLPMLKKAKLGVAMKNAAPELKEVADYITASDNNSDGVAEVINKFVLE